MLRILDELGERLGADGLPGRRLARVTAAARARAWAAIVARHGRLPAGVQDVQQRATVRGADIVTSPQPEEVLRADDVLVVVGSEQRLDQLDTMLTGRS